MLFCTDKVKSGIYPLRIILPGCKLSCSIFTKRRMSAVVHRYTAYIRVYPCLYTKKWKMLQESLHPGKMILNGYIPLLTMSVQNSVFLYDSTVHPYYKGCSGVYEVSNSIGIIIYYIVPMCNADTCTYTVYTSSVKDQLIFESSLLVNYWCDIAQAVYITQALSVVSCIHILENSA